MILKDVLSFYQQDNDSQKLLKKSSKFRRGSVGVRYDRSTTLLDEANYTKEEWDEVTDETIKNAYIKAEKRISLDNAVTELLQRPVTIINC